MFFIVINDNHEIDYCEVKRDDAYIESMKAKAQEFWEKVVANEPIEPQVENSEIETLLGKYLELSSTITELTKEKDLIKDALMTTVPSDKFSCGKYSFSKEHRQGVIQYSKIKELKGINLEKYRGNPFVVIKVKENL
jgi:hypothetical protein